MFGNIKKVFAHRGIHYILTRFGGPVLRRQAFDQKYNSGHWNYFDKEDRTEIVKVIEKYARYGHILDMGCGTGTLASMINPDAFEYYLGVDVSSEAIKRARKYECKKIEFKNSDMQSYWCNDTFDLILFEESLYYVPFFRKRLLRRCVRWLRSQGLVIVTMADPSRFTGMVKMIRKNFHIIEERHFPNSQRLLLVFR